MDYARYTRIINCRPCCNLFLFISTPSNRKSSANIYAGLSRRRFV